jgi:hypothetical protein
MAAGVTKIADLVVPEIFTPYVQQMTEQKSRLVEAGVITRDGAIDLLLAGGGLTFNTPSFRDLDDDAENVSTDNEASSSTPNKIGSSQEISVRLSRNQSWSTMDLAAVLAGADPATAIANRVARYWTRRLQAVTLATMAGVFADNDAAPTGTDTHTTGDMTVDVSGGGYVAGVTDFSAEAMIDAATTMGDSAEDLTAIVVHSIVYSKMQKNNLIDVIPDAEGRATIPTFLNRRVIIDDAMPNPSAGIFHTWLLGANAVRWGMGSPAVPTETDRLPAAGDGGGQEVLHNRVEWTLHPTGHAYIGTAPSGGPSNAATANNLAAAGSWSRVWPERKQIKIARLVTRES